MTVPGVVEISVRMKPDAAVGLLNEALALMTDGDAWAIPPEKQGAADAWWERVKGAIEFPDGVPARD